MKNKYIKRYLTLLIIEEIQFKTTIKYHYTIMRMTTMKKNNHRETWKQ